MFIKNETNTHNHNSIHLRFSFVTQIKMVQDNGKNDSTDLIIEPLSRLPLINFISFNNQEVMRIEADGKIVWTVDSEKRVCDDFHDLAKAFMWTILTLNPSVDCKEIAPQIYEEIKHLIKEK